MIIKFKKVGFAFLLSSCSIMPLLAMDQLQPQQQNQQQELTEGETEQLRQDILQWIRNPNRPAIEQFITQHQNLSRLEEIYLADEHIGAEGAQALANALPYLAQLQMLRLGHDDIGEAGVQALADALPHLTQLRRLALVNDNIEDGGATALAGALPHLTQLRRLVLIGNNIGADGALALYQAIDTINAQRQQDNRLVLVGVDRPQQAQQQQQQN